MKDSFRHTISLLLALLVLVSTQSYSINSHYCGNILVDKSFIKPAKKCAMHQVETTSCAMHDAKNHSNEHQDDNCCDNEFEIIQGQDEIKHHEVSTNLPKPTFVVAFLYSFYLNALNRVVEVTEYYESPPPLSQRDINAFYQVYLI